MNKELVVTRSEGTLRSEVVLLLTLAAGWIDALCFLELDRVFSSFMTGNTLFVGLALAQGDGALFLRAALALPIFVASVTLGALHLGQVTNAQPPGGFRRTLARYLLIEGLVLLAFAILWQRTGDPPSTRGCRSPC